MSDQHGVSKRPTIKATIFIATFGLVGLAVGYAAWLSWSHRLNLVLVQHKAAATSCPALAAPIFFDHLDEAGDFCDSMKVFLKKLQTHVEIHDKAWIAAHVRYPVYVPAGAVASETVGTPAELIKAYDRLFIPSLVHELENVTIDSVDINSGGVMLTNGFWIQQDPASRDFSIISI